MVSPTMRRRGGAAAALCASLLIAAMPMPIQAAEQLPTVTVETPSPPSTQQGGSVTPAVTKTVKIIYLGKQYEEPPPLSLREKIATDKGLAGAKLGLEDDNVTGGFLGIQYQIEPHVVPENGDAVAEAKKILAGGDALILADLEPADLLAVADLPEAKGSVLFNIRSSKDLLRQEQCRVNVFHVMPSDGMRADALAQYLIWKKWPHWFLLKGSTPADEDYAAAVRHAATKFGGHVVEERSYEFEVGGRRVETGHQQVQTQMPTLTQGAATHDVVWVADIARAFGDYLLYRTSDPDPVVGTQGLMAVAWSPVFEQWGGMTLQIRFERRNHREMSERDYAGWLAVRSIGEAATRVPKEDAADIRNYLTSDRFKVAGFKGREMSFRSWDHQLRQPILLVSAQTLISVSPQDGFLHETYPTDTLGIDQPETKCRFPR